MSDIGPEFGGHDLSTVKIPDVEEPQRLTYGDFKKIPLSDIAPGTIITGVPPAKLFASQDWVVMDKIEKAIEYGHDEENLVAPVWVAELPTGREKESSHRALVLRDKHHRTLEAWREGRKIDAEVTGLMPEGQKVMSFSRLRMNTGDPFRGIPEF